MACHSLLCAALDRFEDVGELRLANTPDAVEVVLPFEERAYLVDLPAGGKRHIVNLGLLGRADWRIVLRRGGRDWAFRDLRFRHGGIAGWLSFLFSFRSVWSISLSVFGNISRAFIAHLSCRLDATKLEGLLWRRRPFADGILDAVQGKQFVRADLREAGHAER